MNKLQATLAEFQGKLLIPLNYQTYNSSRAKMIPPEGYMYIVVQVTENSVQIPSVQFEISKRDLIRSMNRDKDSRIPLVIFLARFIQSIPELLKICKHHRLGYDASKYKKQPSLSEGPWVDRKREEAFIIKVLKKKRDWKHLREYFNELNVKRMKFKRK